MGNYAELIDKREVLRDEPALRQSIIADSVVLEESIKSSITADKKRSCKRNGLPFSFACLSASV